MADPFVEIVLSASELKLAAPLQYERFINSIRVFEERCRDDLSAAEANVIFPAQGKAQMVTQLRQKLEACFELRAKYEARK